MNNHVMLIDESNKECPMKWGFYGKLIDDHCPMKTLEPYFNAILEIIYSRYVSSICNILYLILIYECMHGCECN